MSENSTENDAMARYEAWRARTSASGNDAQAASLRRVRAPLMTPERENAYRAARPDVAHAIDSGQMGGSAMDHYFNHGQYEGSRYIQPRMVSGETDMTPYLHPVYHDLTDQANDLGHGGRTDWTGNQVFQAVDGQDVFALNQDADSVWQGMANSVNALGYGGRTDWTPQQVRESFPGTGWDAQSQIQDYTNRTHGDLAQYANMMGIEGRTDWTAQEIAPYVEGTAVQRHTAFNDYLNTLYQGIQTWANENNYGDRNDWSLDEVRQSMQGQNVIEIARGIGLT